MTQPKSVMKTAMVVFDVDETLVHAIERSDLGKTKACRESLLKTIYSLHISRRQSMPETEIPGLDNADFMFAMIPRDRGETEFQAEWISKDILDPAKSEKKDRIINARFFVILRPYLIQLMVDLYRGSLFDIGLFSMGVEGYVDCIADAIQEKVLEVIKRAPTKDEVPLLEQKGFKLFRERRYRSNATRIDESRSYKDINNIPGYNGEGNILLVDNLSANFEGNRKNGVPMRPFSL